jgi:hypothetical protein
MGTMRKMFCVKRQNQWGQTIFIDGVNHEQDLEWLLLEDFKERWVPGGGKWSTGQVVDVLLDFWHASDVVLRAIKDQRRASTKMKQKQKTHLCSWWVHLCSWLSGISRTRLIWIDFVDLRGYLITSSCQRLRRIWRSCLCPLQFQWTCP